MLLLQVLIDHLRLARGLFFVGLSLGMVWPLAAQSGSKRDRFPDFDSVVLLPTPPPMPQPGQRPPEFPSVLRQAGKEAYVVAAAIVDTVGAVEPWSVSFLQLTDGNFRSPVCDWLLHLRMEPYADSTGRRRALVLVPLAFEITGGAPKGAPATLAYELIVRNTPRDSVRARLNASPHCK